MKLLLPVQELVAVERAHSRHTVARRMWVGGSRGRVLRWKGVWGAVRGLLGSRAQTPGSWGAVSPRGVPGDPCAFSGIRGLTRIILVEDLGREP